MKQRAPNSDERLQLSITGSKPSHTTDYWGDKLTEKQEGICRIGLINPTGFTLKAGSAKDDQIRDLMRQMEVDVMGFPEVNVCWHLLSPCNRIQERTMGWFETMHRTTAYNYKDESSSRHQFGGTMLLSVNNAAGRVMKSGRDETGLGRWTWTRYRGRNGIVTRIVCAYRPCLPSGTGKAFSVYAQHQRYFDEQLEEICPREAFTRDLCGSIDEWLTQGEQLVIVLDANEEMREGTLAMAFKQRNLREVLLERHGNNAPPTTDNGSAVIDGIWATPSIGIERGGYLAAGEAIPRTNHRCLWIDVKYEILYGHKLPPIITYATRRLKLQDPRVVKKFIKAYREWIKAHALDERAFALQLRSGYPLTEEDAVEYEWLDNMKIVGLKNADKACRKLPMGEVPWSPDLRRLRSELGYWQLVYKKIVGRKVSSSVIETLRKKALLEKKHIRTITLEAAISEERRAYKVYVDFKKTKSRETRETFLDELAAAIADAGNTSHESAIKTLKTREQMKRTHRRISWVFESQTRGAITFVEVTDGQGEVVEMSAQLEVEGACMQENEQRFRQANSTPFMRSPLVEEFGYLGIGTNARAVLEGNYTPPHGTDKYAVMLLDQLKWPDNVRQDQLSSTITTDQFVNGWKKAKERTTTGSTFLHFGHFKAGVRDQTIADFEATMAHIPYSTGYSPKRWQHVIDFELLKKEGVYRPETFRTIQLYEPDFNQNNRFLGREAMAHAEKHNNLAIEQYGSRKRLSAILHAVNKVLSFDLIRQYRTPAALCSNDAKSCYDRVIHSVASLCFQHQGVPEPPLVSMLTTLQQAVHNVRTAYGDSVETYGGPEWTIPPAGFAWGDKGDGPMSGMGQGNGAAPAGWTVISSPMLEIMKKHGHTTQFKAFISGDELIIVGFAFVDDKDLLKAAKLGEHDYEEVVIKMQEGLDLWEGLLKATGGALVPEKSYWYLIDFKWKDGLWKYASADDTPAELTMVDKDDIRQTLERLQVHEARRSLGCRVAPDGNMKAQIDYMRSVATEWSDKLRSGHLTKYEAWTALTTRIMKTFLYAAPAITISEKDARHIMAPVMKSGLNSIGIQKFLPRAVAYAPLKYQGLAIPNLHVEVGIQHIALLLQETYANSPTGKLLRMSIEATKVEIGRGGSLFSLPYQEYSQIATDSWVKHTWKFVSENEISIADQVGDLQLRRHGDKFLTDVFIQNGYKGALLKKLNACRMFLKVETVSDVTSADGKSILGWVLEEGQGINNNPQHEWPNQQDPGRQAWVQWKLALGKCLCSGNLSHGLLHNLGQWVDNSANRWEWWFSLQDERIYRRTNGRWEFYLVRRLGQQTRRRRFIYGGNVDDEEVPTRCRRATVRRIENGDLQLLSYSGNEPRTINNAPLYQTLSRRIRESPAAIKWAIGNYAVADGGEEIANAIKQGSAIAVCDGSFKDAFGTAAYVIESDTSMNRLVAVLVAPGEAKVQSSFRSELAGLYGVVVMVNTICEQFGVTEGLIEVGCDCEKALSQSFDEQLRYVPSTQQSDFDLRSAIRQKIDQSPIKFRYRHVAGHQDDGIEDLDRWAKLNVEMDALAKVYWEDESEKGYVENEAVQGEVWSVSIRGRKIRSCLDAEIREHILGEAQLNRWEEKGKLAVANRHKVNWLACEKAMKNLKIGRRHWIAKHVSGHAGVGVKKVQWKMETSAACPRCGEDEDCTHVWECHSPDARWLRMQRLFELESWLDKQQTHPELLKELMNGLRAWSVGVVRMTSYGTSDSIREAVEQQDEIGWSNMIEGWVAIGWTEVQEAYYRSFGSRRTGLRWTVAIINKLWDIAWDLWEQRNGILHDKEYQEQLQNLPGINNEVRYQYQKGGATLPSRLRFLFEGPLEELLETSMKYKQKGLRSVMVARRAADEREAAQDQSLQGSRQLLRAWLDSAREDG